MTDRDFLADRDLAFLASTLAGIAAAVICGSVAKLERTVVALVTVQAIIALIRFYGGSDTYVSGTVLRAAGSMGNPMPLALVLAISLPMCLSMALSDDDPVSRHALFSCSMLMLIALICTGYRDASIVVLLVFVLYSRRVSDNRLTVGIIAGILAACVLVVFFNRMHGSENWIASTNSAVGRLTVWRAGWMSFLAHPIFGVGAGHVRIPVSTWHQHVRSFYIYNEPLSLPLYFLDELGVIGGCIFIVVAASVIKILKEYECAPNRALAAAWIALVALGVTETPFGPPEFFATNALVAAMLGATLLAAICTTAAKCQSGESTPGRGVPCEVDRRRSTHA